MRKTGFKILIVSLLIFNLLNEGFSQEKKMRNIVIFYSLNAGLPACQYINEGICQTLRQQSGDVFNILPKYFDLERTKGKTYGRMLIGQYNSRIRADSDAVPRNSIFINRDKSFFPRYNWYSAIILFFLVCQTFFIFYLIRLNRRQQKIKTQILENENLYREMIRRDRLDKLAELAASLSHELNQPLTAIMYNAQACMRFLKSGKLEPALAEEILGNIIEDNKRAGAIISSVRNLMQIEIREKENFDMNSLVKETTDIIRNDAILQRVIIVNKLTKDPAIVLGDKIQLQQVLMNLIRNAMEALVKNDPGDKRVEIVTESSKDFVTVSVSDSGPGISASIIDEIFKPFVTLNKKGFGIGLALSRSIIQNHNGVIWAENMKEGGARISFRLKAVQK